MSGDDRKKGGEPFECRPRSPVAHRRGVETELSQCLELLLYSTRIVKNVAHMIGEHEFIVDGVSTSLA